MILENTFTSISDMVDRVFPFLKLFKSLLLTNYWRSIDLIDKSNFFYIVKLPILFIMADQDEIVPYNHMVKLLAKA